MPRDLAVLLVMSPQRRAFALEQLDCCRGAVLVAGDVAAACRLLVRQAVDVVLTDRRLGDSDWRTVMDKVKEAGSQASVIVTTPVFDSNLLADIYARGAYDLLVEPYSREELLSVLEGAAHRSYMRGLGWRAAS